ncbi:MAG TPA: hypothetical protein VM536_18205 [Chloroflexia bacterium]|nr:hypothetical protein [Chloroflexia bacterium]
MRDGLGHKGPALGLARVGIGLGATPWLLLGPLATYGMDFMLWTWVWPLFLGAAGLGAGLLALLLRDPCARRTAVVAVVLGLLSAIAALLGFGGMVAGMSTM